MSIIVTIEGQQEASGNSFEATLTNVSREALEALALEGYKSGELTAYQVQQMLGFESRVEVDGFLKAKGLPMEYSLEDLERDRATLRTLSGE
jgi:hypothetical protein